MKISPAALQTPKIDIVTPSDSSHHQTKPSSRAPSRMSAARLESVHDEDGDNETVKDDARTVPVETIVCSSFRPISHRNMISDYSIRLHLIKVGLWLPTIPSNMRPCYRPQVPKQNPELQFSHLHLRVLDPKHEVQGLSILHRCDYLHLWMVVHWSLRRLRELCP